MEVLAVIPARGGSKGIPRKNVSLLAGKPLIAHTIEQARKANMVTRTIVSTDDDEIAEVSRQYGASVVERPKVISGDKASSEQALLHTLDYLKRRENYRPELLVFLQCTSPLRLPDDIDGAINQLIDKQADSLVGAEPFNLFLWKYNEAGEAIGINHDKMIRPMRQEIDRNDPQWLETGVLYVMRVDGFKKAEHRFFGKTVIYNMPPERCLDIDEPVDFKIAEVVLREREQVKV